MFGHFIKKSTIGMMIGALLLVGTITPAQAQTNAVQDPGVQAQIQVLLQLITTLQQLLLQLQTAQGVPQHSIPVSKLTFTANPSVVDSENSTGVVNLRWNAQNVTHCNLFERSGEFNSREVAKNLTANGTYRYQAGWKERDYTPIRLQMICPSTYQDGKERNAEKTIEVKRLNTNTERRDGEIYFNQRVVSDYADATESQVRQICKDAIASLQAAKSSGEFICAWGSQHLFKEEITAPSAMMMQTAIAFGVYEGSYPTGVRHGFNYHPQGEVTVYIPDGGYPENSILLMVSAYEPVKWRVTGPGVHQIGAVWQSGYHAQEVVGLPASITINNGGRGFTHKAEGASYTTMKNVAREKYGTEIQQFMGAYSAKEFTVLFKG